jgi:MFS superfamily sulfate permease-like transporter
LDIKWFFVIIGIFLTFAILAGMYFISTFTLLQQQKYYEDSQKGAIERFDNSTVIHDFLFKNITDLKKGLDPILATVKNATDMRIQQDIHYNQTAEDFKKIQQVLQIKLQDHITLGQVNQTVNQILGILTNNQTTTNTGNGSIIIENTTKPIPIPPVPSPTPLPVPAPIVNNDTNKKENDTGGIVIENITDIGNDKGLILLRNQ